MILTPTITAFEKSPDKGRGLARDMIVRWALEEVGQQYDVRLVSFKEMKQPAHLKISPFGKIPTYEEGGLTIFETGAIVLHIAETRKGLLNDHANIRMRQIAWMFAAVSTVEPPIVELSAAFLLEKDKPWYQDRLPMLQENVRVRLAELSKRLSNGDWLDIEFSAGDLMMVSVLRRLASSGLLNEFENIAAYVARGEARPAFQRAFAAQLAVFNGPQISVADQVATIIKEIAKLLYALSDLETNRFMIKFNQAPTTIKVYDAILELEYAANSKELRDTGDDRVHTLCEQIRMQSRKLHTFFRLDLFPNSEQQKLNWTKPFRPDLESKYVFREDGSLQVSVLESELVDSTLHVKRYWSRYGNFDGTRGDFKIQLDVEQAQAFKKKASEFLFDFLS